MIKKQLKTLGHKAIVKKGLSHQEAFDEISLNDGVDAQMLADELSKIPSSGKQKSTASLRYAFIACLILIVAYRIITVLLIYSEVALDVRFLLLMIPLVLIGPAFGFSAAVFHRSEHYKTAGILLALTFLQSILRGYLALNLQSLLLFIPVALGVFLAFYIPSKLKTPYKKTLSEKFVDGELVKTTNYVFEDTRTNASDLLDTRF